MEILGAVLSMLAVFSNAMLAIWFGPRAAARLTHRLHREQRERDETRAIRQRVFITLMQERATSHSPEAIKAFNLIDTAFAGEPAVRQAWAALLADTGEHLRHTQLRTLLERMATALGLDDHLVGADFERVYAPDDQPQGPQIDTLHPPPATGGSVMLRTRYLHRGSGRGW